MDQLFALRILILVLFGVLISLTDLRRRRIYNKHLIIMAAVGVCLFFATPGNIINYGVNFLVCLLIGVVLWKIRFWNAGDGKLFAVISLYLPPAFYDTIFPSELLIFNVLILSFILWLPSLILRTKTSEKAKAVKTAFKPSNVANLALLIFGLFWVVMQVMSASGVSIYLFNIIAALLVYMILNKFFKSYVIYLLLPLAALRVIYDPIIFSTGFLISYMPTLFVLLVAYAVGILALHISHDERYLRDIKPGDIPMGIMTKSKGDIDFNNFMEKTFKEKERIMARGFSEDDIEQIKKIKNIEGFVVKGYVPSAHIFFAAAILTILLNSDIISYLALESYTLIYE